MRRDIIDLEDYDDPPVALSKQEEFIVEMDMDDVQEFLSGIRPSTALMEAIKDFDEHEVGSILFDELRSHAKDATT